MNKKNVEFYLYAELIILAVLSMLVSVFLMRRNGVGVSDTVYYWRNVAYTMRGYSLEQLKASNIVLDDIGAMQGIGIMTYGRMICNLILPGFLPFKYAFIYYTAITVMVIIMIFYNMSHFG